jgi:hypothetical protein
MSKGLRYTEEQLAAITKRNADLVKGPAPAPPPQKKVAKYRNTPIEVDGKQFDSKGEAERFLQLKYRQMAGEIDGLRRQVKFGLTVNGQSIGVYIADFVYYDSKARRLVVEDWKSPVSKTDLYEWKKKHLLAEHGIEILETGHGKP